MSIKIKDDDVLTGNPHRMKKGDTFIGTVDIEGVNLESVQFLVIHVVNVDEDVDCLMAVDLTDGDTYDLDAIQKPVRVVDFELTEVK